MGKKRTTYDELYWKYKGWVVLILKQFMYKAYDESARVLSFITDYKLYESIHGIAAAGPDKEKIMKLLSAHHVNYVISEYGEITEMRSFDDNRFYQYLTPSLSIPVESSNVEENEDDEKTSSPPPESKKIVPPEWLKPSLVVTHKKFGTGVVSSISVGQSVSFSVQFPDEGEKKFLFPDAFDKGFLCKEMHLGQ